ncbi:MAG: ABC transporter substrate-binding protein [Clostridiales bacterium]|nr:ABC transporter substrate-binding protein [Clostridiales bacterium]
MKKTIVILLALLIPLSFTACGSSGNTLTMATDALFPPYEFYEGESIIGIDADIARLIAGKLGMELEIMDMDFEAIVGAVQTGKADMGMAGMAVTEDRLQNVNFSTSYATGIQVVIVRDDGPVQSLDDLFETGGFTVGVLTNTTGDIYTTWDLEDEGLATVERYMKSTDVLLALIAGKVDCMVIDDEPAKAYVADNPGLKILDTVYATEDYAICVAKKNTGLLDKINAALDELIADGSVQAVIDKYIKVD